VPGAVECCKVVQISIRKDNKNAAESAGLLLPRLFCDAR
jgi:hypothetical protein